MKQEDHVHGGEAQRWGGWSWRAPSRGQHFRTCSYCGSIHPADLVESMEAPITVEAALARPRRMEWADMKYGWPHKMYVDVPNRDPKALFVVSTRSDAPRDGEEGWTEVDRELEKEMEREGWGRSNKGSWVRLGARATHHAKFYSVHLADPEIPEEVKEKVHKLGGLRFEWLPGGKVRWSPA